MTEAEEAVEISRRVLAQAEQQDRQDEKRDRICIALLTEGPGLVTSIIFVIILILIIAAY